MVQAGRNSFKALSGRARKAYHDTESAAYFVPNHGGSMGEIAGAMKMLGSIPPAACLIKFPSGRWGFVGSVDYRLAFVRKEDGSEPTIAEVEKAKSFGVGFSNLKTRAWETKEAAIAAADAIGAKLNYVEGGR